MACFCPHQGANNFVFNSCSLTFITFVLGYEAREKSELTQTHLSRHFTIPEHHSRDHWRVNSLHNKVSAQDAILADFGHLFGF